MDKTNVVKTRKRSKKKKSLGKKIGITLLVFLVVVVSFVFIMMWKVYSDVRNSTDNMYEEVSGQEKLREEPILIDNGDEPFSILLLGIDTGDLGRVEKGRSDTMMVMTINPKTEKTNIVSIPRDTYTEIVGNGTRDKINHAYAFGGTSMSVNTVQNLFDIPIDYYISINMEGLQQIIDATGGIDVTPTLTFETDSGHSFTQGQKTHMNGSKALAYSRMRYDDPNGDYGRQERQRDIVVTTMRKVSTFNSLKNYQNILDSLSTNMQTNLSFDDMVDAFTKYNSAINSVEQVQLKGTGSLRDGIYYEFIPDEELERVSNQLKLELEID